MCAVCGSAGLDDDALMVFCSHCGDGFHTYCLPPDFALTRSIMQFGFRSVNSTVHAL